MLGGISHRVRPQVEVQLLRHRPRLKKPPSGGSNSGAASASPPSRFERLTSLKPPALPGDIYFYETLPGFSADGADSWFRRRRAIIERNDLAGVAVAKRTNDNVGLQVSRQFSKT